MVYGSPQCRYERYEELAILAIQPQFAVRMAYMLYRLSYPGSVVGASGGARSQTQRAKYLARNMRVILCEYDIKQDVYFGSPLFL